MIEFVLRITSLPLKRSFPLGARTMDFLLTRGADSRGMDGSTDRLLDLRYSVMVSEFLERDLRIWDPDRSLDGDTRLPASDGGFEDVRCVTAGLAEVSDIERGMSSVEGRARVTLGFRGFLDVGGGGSNFEGIFVPKTFKWNIEACSGMVGTKLLDQLAVQGGVSTNKGDMTFSQKCFKS